jgi:outer membrane protein TolC
MSEFPGFRRLLARYLCAVIASLVLATTIAAAPAEVSTAIPGEGAPEPEVVDGTLRLSLDEAIELSLARNLGLVVERYNDAEARFSLAQSFGIYDLNLTSGVSAFSETSPSATNLAGADVSTQDQQVWNFGLSQMLKSGGGVALDFNNYRNESNSSFATINPLFRSDLDFSFTQPLLRGLGKRLTERGIQIARTNLDISRETFAQQVSASIQQVVNAYWTLVGARNQLIVTERSLELAKQLHEQNKVRVEVGTLAPLELVQSEAGIATRQEEIIRARAAVADGEDALRQLLNLDRDIQWDALIETTSQPEIERVTVDLDSAIDRALESRPEVVSGRLGLSTFELDVDYFHNQLLPQLDFSARYGFNGLGGNVTERDFFTGEILFQAPGGYSDALNQITDASFEGWSVALDLSMPLQNRSAKAQFAKAEVAHDRALAALRQLELQVATEVRRAARGLDTAAQQIDSARVSRRLQERTLEAEQKRYDNGMSTSYRVLEIQRDLIDASNREVVAITGYRTALAEFQRVTGVLNEESGVVIVDAGD